MAIKSEIEMEKEIHKLTHTQTQVKMGIWYGAHKGQIQKIGEYFNKLHNFNKMESA